MTIDSRKTEATIYQENKLRHNICVYIYNVIIHRDINTSINIEFRTYLTKIALVRCFQRSNISNRSLNYKYKQFTTYCKFNRNNTFWIYIISTFKFLKNRTIKIQNVLRFTNVIMELTTYVYKFKIPVTCTFIQVKDYN